MREQNGFIPSSVDGQGIRHFGNYDLVRRIDIGGMGEVYLARQRTAFGREVAVKIIRPDLAYDITARKRFLREAEVGAYLKHDHILPLVEFGEEQGRLFLVTPYIKGGTLGKCLHLGPLSPAEIYPIFTSLVQAVSYLHKRGVVHRDLKPSNILLDREEDSDRVYVRLIDFGIASLRGSLATNAALTSAGQEMGTVAYMAPERLDGIAAPSNDIYSLGIILYQMLTGRLPNADDMVPLPDALASVVRHSTTHALSERLSSADELLEAFELAYEELRHSAGQQINQPIAPVTPPVAVAVDEAASTLPASGEGDLVHAELEPSLADEVVDDDKTLKASRRGARTTEDQLALPVAEALQPEAALPVRSAVMRRERAVQQGYRSTEDQPGRSVPQRITREVPSVAQEVLLPPLPLKGISFSSEDYDAPTSYADVEQEERQLANVAVLTPQQPARRTGQRRSLWAIIAVLCLVICFIIGASGYLLYLTLITAQVAISPKVQTISSVFTLTAHPGQKTVDASTASLPAEVLTSTQSGSLQGATTGKTDCTLNLFDFNCKQAVSYNDVGLLANQIQPGLKTQIQHDLQSQAQSQAMTTVGAISYSGGTISSNPTVGTASNTVTVTLSEQGSIEGIKLTDAHTLALQLLTRELKPGYALMDTQTQVSQPVIRGIDGNGNVTIAIAAGGVERYQIAGSQLTELQNELKGMSQATARTFILRHYPDLDPASVGIHISYGSNLPNNAQKIKVTMVDPTNLPSVQLSPLPTATSQSQ